MIRVFDILLSILAFVILSPLLIIVTIILSFTGEREVFYTQNRVGRFGKVFKIYKFATMQKNSPNIGAGTITLENDPRLLPFGKFLRKSKINELPQLLNIIKGEMSFVGPRPLMEVSFNGYDTETQKIIKYLKPGLSGIGSLVLRDEERILNDIHGIDEKHVFYYEVIAKYKGTLEKWFFEKTSLFYYFKVIILTFIVIIFPKNKILFKVLRDIPAPPKELKKYIKIK